MKAPVTNIVIPGRGVVNVDALAVNRAIEAHDERLRFGYNEANGDWVIYIKMPREFDAAYYIDGSPVYPILGFGREIPSPDEAIARLSRADTRQRGNDILSRINKENAKITAQLDELTNEQAEETAQRVELAARKAGLTEYDKINY